MTAAITTSIPRTWRFRSRPRWDSRRRSKRPSPILLEPVMAVEVSCPDECMGDVIGDLNSRRGKVLGVDSKGHGQVIKALVPMSEILKYAPDLRSITSGRGSFESRILTLRGSAGRISPRRSSRRPKRRERRARNALTPEPGRAACRHWRNAHGHRSTRPQPRRLASRSHRMQRGAAAS